MRTAQLDGHQITIDRARPFDLVDLRHEVLRKGLPREEAIFAGDEDELSRHYAARLDGQVVCCATLHMSPWEGEPAYQLRGMATDAAVRGRGVGRALMAVLEADVLADSPVRLLWCNARIGALRFYQSLGWEVRSELFEIPTAGPHHRMTKRLEDAVAESRRTR